MMNELKWFTLNNELTMDRDRSVERDGGRSGPNSWTWEPAELWRAMANINSS